KERKKSTIVISSFILFTILSAYTASQYIAASKTFNIFFNIDSNIGIILTALIIASYIILGGLRASVWTDILQIIVMAIVTLTMLLISFYDIGGIKNLITSLNNIDPNLLAPFSGMTLTSIIGFILGWSSAAFGFGLSQPQIIVRFFAGKSPEETQKAKWTYISFLQFTWIGMTLFGLIARALLNNVDDPESVLFVYVNNNFSSIVAAIILVGVFSAIASTIDSLVLASGNILSVDILKLFNNKISQKRIAHQLSSLLTIILTVILALYVQSSVFTLSAFAVSFLAATVGVSVLLKIFKPNVSVFTINTVLLVSGIFAIMWRLLGYHNFINEAFPSVIIGLLIGIISEKILIKAKVEVTT
ncbi:MAG: hypothetical protein CO129_06760, partial [Ignavibacteriales bacterium CG_4_9_14_3_um_filter_34_10]